MYYRARYYAHYLNRWIQPDTIVPQPGNPQTLNRYSYVNNNPVRYTDPTGHCNADRSDQDCWDVYNKLIGVLCPGFNVTDLWMWSKGQLQGLTGWVNRGVRFAGNWYADNVGTIMESLNAVQIALGDLTNAALGLDHGTLTYRKGIDDAQLGAKVAGQAPFDWKNQISFSSGDLSLGTALHETGHLADWHINHESGLWSDKNFVPKEYLRFWLFSRERAMYTGKKSDPPNSTSNPVEDFADTFAWKVMADAGIALPSAWHNASQNRQGDLATGLGSLTVQANP
jgi:hypothetical protein